MSNPLVLEFCLDVFFIRGGEFMESLKPKLFEVLYNYSKEQLIKDIISGIIVAIIAISPARNMCPPPISMINPENFTPMPVTEIRQTRICAQAMSESVVSMLFAEAMKPSNSICKRCLHSFGSTARKRMIAAINA